jgi:hypothetical protein
MQSAFSTGIVIAGFGDNDLYPKVFELAVDGGLLDIVRCYDLSSCDIAKEKAGAAISTFAQDDTVQAFLNGMDERFEIFNVGLFTHTLQLIAEEILIEHTQLTGDERALASAMVAKRARESLADFRAEVREFADDEFTSPVLDVLRTAPKETLAELAESLVSITSLKMRVSGDLETVGGPVDVALISKGEGFIWIKRKLYFDPSLNPHYQHNYFRGVDR